MLCGSTSQVAKEVDLYYLWESALSTRMNDQWLGLGKPRSHLIKNGTQHTNDHYSVDSMMGIAAFVEWFLSTDMKPRPKTGTTIRPSSHGLRGALAR